MVEGVLESEAFERAFAASSFSALMVRAFVYRFGLFWRNRKVN